MQHSSPTQSPTVVVVGLGKIGLPLAAQYAGHGWRVIGCDIDSAVVKAVNAGIALVEEPELDAKVATFVAQGLLSATEDTSQAVRQAQVVVVIVPVMVNTRHEVDFTNIDAATRAIGAGLQPGTLVVYETTLPVGTTADRLRAILESTSYLRAGTDFYLAYSPERVSSGSIFRDLRVYPKIVGGVDAPSTEAGAAFYHSVLDAEIMLMKSSSEAEFVKLIETTYRDVNIALANEFACFADARGLDVMAAIAGANSQPYSHIHTPGVGVGGHCIPVYPYFLLAGMETDAQQYHSAQPALLLPRAARQINDAMAEYAVSRIEQITGPLVDLAVLILGVAYRGDVRETAFTSAQLLQNAFVAHGAQVYVDDPLFSEDELRRMGYTPLTTEAKGKIRALLLQANHRVYQQCDFHAFPHCQVVLDGRRGLNRAEVEAAGLHYIAIGDGKRAEDAPKDDGSATPFKAMVWNRGE